MFTKKNKAAQIDPEQHELLENAQKRVKQKKGFFSHLVIFLIGSLFLLLINKVLKYGANYDWALWAIVLWAFFLILHLVRVYVTHQFMDKEWERKQREKLVAQQKKRIAELQKEIETEFPLSQINKKKE